MFKITKLILIVICSSISVFGQIKVACIGNSVTYGYGLENPKLESYPAQLQNLIGTAYEVRNFGHSGANLLRKGHNPYYKTVEYAEALEYRPDIAVIHLGLNDTDPRNWPNYSYEFQNDYALLIESFKKANPAVKVYITSLTPIFSGHRRFLSGTRDWYRAIQQLLPEIAKNNQVEIIDIHTDLKHRIDLFDDYIHPNKQGAGFIAKNVALAIAQLEQKLSLNPSLTSYMVLQRNTSNLIFGTATPNKLITLNFDGKNYSSLANLNGKWSITLPPKVAGGPYTITISCDNEKAVLENVLFGDVFLASGQSNMAFPKKSAKDAETVVTKIPSNIRLFKAKNITQTDATVWDTTTLQKVNNLEYFTGKWELPTSSNIANFSAMAYSFAYFTARTENIPVGIIDISVGGSTTESWINPYDLETDNLLANYLTNWKTSDFMMDFVRTRTALNLKNAKVKHQRHPYGPGYNFAAGINHFLNTQLTGVLWYQGESNAHNVALFEHLFNTLVNSWRSSFKQELPFFYVQLPSIQRPTWGKIRNSQRKFEDEINKCYMAVTLDLGDSSDVHPHQKIPIGQRLAKLVQKHVYGKSLNADSPKLKEVQFSKDKIILTFNRAKTLKTINNHELQGFQAMDLKGQVHNLSAKIIRKTKIEILQPNLEIQQLQYGFEPYTAANLCNEEGIPASTFVWGFKNK